MTSFLLAALVTLLAVGPARQAAPAFKARSLDGTVFTNESLKGRVVLIQFWTTWCGFCRREQPAVEDVLETFGDRGLPRSS